MEQPEPNKAQIRGKDLIGGIKVMPMGLDAAIKKRTSGEFKSEDVQQVCDVLTKPLVHNQEIEQDKLKTQIVSAITDLEGDREFVDFGRENKPIDLTSPPQAFSPPPKSAFTPTKQDPFSPSKQDMFSPPPLEPMEPPKPQPVLSSFTSEPAELAPQLAPTRNGIQNGFSEFVSNTKNLELQTIQESSQMKIITDAFQMNGNHEESGSIQGSSSSSSLLQKIMTPAPTEYDSGSLKRRDPKKNVYRFFILQRKTPSDCG
eukprot:GFUD01058609.1.p1 GENE.GFUD01058609.1~~GFUD01058609.1.p1  ORF type:complete len:259 (+),score=57.62 GFUD01058609.1:317-1093(+)